MKKARRWRDGWRVGGLIMALVPMMLLAMPAEAGLGDLIDSLLGPVNDIPVVGDIVEPVVAAVVDPVIDDWIDPLAGPILDPITNQVLAPLIDPGVGGDVAPVEESVVAPVVDMVLAPAGDTGGPTPTTSETTPSVSTSYGSGGEALATVSGTVPVASTSQPGSGDPREIRSLNAALAVQAELSRSNGSISTRNGISPIASMSLSGLTGWLRNAASGLLDLLGLPIRLFELLSRALLTAGSGLVAPLSLLLAFMCFAIKDKYWVKQSGVDSRE